MVVCVGIVSVVRTVVWSMCLMTTLYGDVVYSSSRLLISLLPFLLAPATQANGLILYNILHVQQCSRDPFVFRLLIF